MATVTELQAEIARLRERYRIAQNGLATLNKSLQSNQAILARYTNEVSSIPGQIATLEAQINANQNTSPASAATSASDDGPKGPTKPTQQTVSDNGRIVNTPDTTTPSNAIPPATLENTQGATTGTNAPVRTTEQTQATGTGYNGDGNAVGLDVRAEDGTLSNLRKNPETGELYDPGGIPGGVDLTTNPGTPTNDDALQKSTTTAQTDLNAAANNNSIKVTPQPNVLDRYSSYAWSASVYLMNLEQYAQLMNSKVKAIDGYTLLFQSGGAGVSDGVIRPPVTGSGGGGEESVFDPTANRSNNPGYPSANRSPFFTNDFYVDSVTLEHQCLGKGSGAAHQVSNIKFTVVEPQGITLLDRMYAAVANNEPRDGGGKINYTAVTYLMVLRFYGYDDAGNIVYPVKGGLESLSGTSDPTAVVEKFIPFKLNRVNWTIGSKTVSYDFDCSAVGQDIGGSSSRGTIPYDVQLVDSTVGGLLGGDVKYVTPTKLDIANAEDAARDNEGSSNPAPAPATAAPKPKQISQGLMAAMNDFQKELVYRGTYTIADEYSIEFVGIPGLANATDISGAKIQVPNVNKNKATSPMKAPTTKNADNLDQDKLQVDTESLTFSITAGQQILQAIELVIRNSEYINKQKLVVTDPDGKEEEGNGGKKQFTWFSISIHSERKPGGIDPKRNDYAYKIKYIVTPYLVKNVDSKYFRQNRFTGVHKRYPFWFTGQNIAVKDYQETLNTTFTATLSGSGKGTSIIDRSNAAGTTTYQDLVRYNYSPRSNESSSGADGKTNEPNANAAELIYNASDLANTKVKIIGDPAWIMQGSFFKPITEGTVLANSARTGFEADGTVSFDSQDILFEMLWQRPEDYDLSTGLADPYSRTSQADGGKREPLQSRVYLVTKVISEFKGGSFDQTLEGSIFRLPINPNKSTQDSSAVDASRAAAEAAKNKTKDTATRTGVDLSTEAGRNARTAFSSRDPRRTDSPDGGKAAILGSTGAYKEAQFVSNEGGAAFGNPSITRQGITAGAFGTSGALQNAPPPLPATDGDNNVLDTTATSEEVASTPSKLPGGGRPITPGSLRDIQRQAQLARQAPAAGNPTSTTIPNNQKIASDGG